jgi:hypothetical protein
MLDSKDTRPGEPRMSMHVRPVSVDGWFSYSVSDDGGTVSIDCEAVYPSGPWVSKLNSDVDLEVSVAQLPQLLQMVREVTGEQKAEADRREVEAAMALTRQRPGGTAGGLKAAVFAAYFADEATTVVRDGVTQRSVARKFGIDHRRVGHWVRAEAEARDRSVTGVRLHG